MSKSVLRSAKPYWIYLIITGKKIIEVGKDSPKAKDWNKIVEMYCSKDMRSFNRIPEKDRGWMRKYLDKVACRFVCDRIDEYAYDVCDGVDIDDDELLETCLDREEINIYAKGKTLYGLHITDLKIYDTPKELGEFRTTTFGENDSCNTCENLPTTENGIDYYTARCNHCKKNHEMFIKKLTRALQSWCYVEEI